MGKEDEDEEEKDKEVIPAKNRYRDIRAPQATRIRLTCSKSSTYINANFVDVS